jgi:hypothetical protein
MEAGEQLLSVDGAFGRGGSTHIHEVDRATSIEPLHERDLTTAERTRAVEPGSKRIHDSRYGVLSPNFEPAWRDEGCETVRFFGTAGSASSANGSSD